MIIKQEINDGLMNVKQKIYGEYISTNRQMGQCKQSDLSETIVRQISTAKIHYISSTKQLIRELYDGNVECLPLVSTIPHINIRSKINTNTYLTTKGRLLFIHQIHTLDSPSVVAAIECAFAFRNFTASYTLNKLPTYVSEAVLQYDSAAILNNKFICLSKENKPQFTAKSNVQLIRQHKNDQYFQHPSYVQHSTYTQQINPSQIDNKYNENALKMVSLGELHRFMLGYKIQWTQKDISYLLQETYSKFKDIAQLIGFQLKQVLIDQALKICVVGSYFQGEKPSSNLERNKQKVQCFMQQCLAPTLVEWGGRSTAAETYLHLYLQSYFKNINPIDCIPNHQLVDIYSSIQNEDALTEILWQKANELKEMSVLKEEGVSDAHSSQLIDYYKKIIESKSRSANQVPTQNKAQQLFLALVLKQSEKLSNAGHYQQALCYLNQAINLMPMQPALLIALSEVHCALGQYNEAEKHTAVLMGKLLSEVMEEQLLFEKLLSVVVEINLPAAVLLMDQDTFIEEYKYQYFAAKIMLIRAIALMEHNKGSIALMEQNKEFTLGRHRSKQQLAIAQQSQMSPTQLLNASLSLLEAAQSKPINDPMFLINILECVGDIHLYRKCLISAEQSYSKAKVIYLTLGTIPVDRYAGILTSLANLELIRSNYKDALEYYEAAVQKASSQNIAFRLYILGNMALVQLKLEMKVQAKDTLLFVLERMPDKQTIEYAYYQHHLNSIKL